MVKLTVEAIEGFVKSVLWSSFDGPTDIPEFHRELWQLCCSDYPLVAIAAPRGHAKSTAISLAYVLCSALFRQSDYILLISDTFDQASQFLGDIKKELQINENLIELFGIKGFEKDTESDIIVKFTDGKKFRITAKGSEQKVRGLKWEGKRPNLIIGDDLENDEIVMNPERRTKFKQWMLGALLPCRSPKGKVRIVGTILHLDSFLAGVVPLEGDYHTVDQGLRSVSNNPRLMFKGVLYRAHVGATPSEISKPSDILWKERFDKAKFVGEYTMALQMGHPDKYSQEYLNRPIDDSVAIFRKSDFVAMSEAERERVYNNDIPLLYYAGVDLAVEEKQKADFSVFHIVGMDSNGIMYHINTIREKMDASVVVDTLLSIQNRYHCQWIAVEQDKTGKSILPFLKERMLQTGIFPNIVGIIPHADKTARAMSIVGRMRIGGIRFDKEASYYPILETEMLTFPRGKKDDQVDAYSCIGLGLAKMNTAQTREQEIEDDLIEQEKQFTHGLYDGRSTVTGY